MKRGTENMAKNIIKNIFYKTNPRGGISLIVLVITIIVVIILAAAVIISLQNNNPMVEANKARIESDVTNIQAIFTNTVGKIMAENQDVVTIVGGQLNSITTGGKKTKGETTYKIVGEDGNVAVEGSIIFGIGQNAETIYYTGKELPIYSSETKWHVDNQGMISVEVGGVLYGEGSKSDNPQLELKEEIEIAVSANPMLQSFVNSSDRKANYYAEEYRTKITKIKFAISDKVPENRIEAWDISEVKDKSVMAWVEDDGNGGYILTIAGKNKIIANQNSSYLFRTFNNLKEIENFELLDTSNVTNMEEMFYYCVKLNKVNFTACDISKVVNMSCIFQYCKELTSIGDRGLDINTVKMYSMGNMQNAFRNCYKLTATLNIIGTKNEKNKFYNNYMFEDTASLSSINAKITLNYTVENESVVDEIISMYSSDSNVVKGALIN